MVTDAHGKSRLVFTTKDGMTIEGRMLAPDGRDLNAALLGRSRQSVAGSEQTQLSTHTPAVSSAVRPAPPSTPKGVSSALMTPQSADTSPTTPDGSAPQAKTAPMPATARVPVAKTPAELLQQANDHAIWFSAGKPKPDAPVLYFLADPTCPYCAASTDKLAAKVKSGAIDLRIVLAPILSRQSVYQAASILQSKHPAEDFVSHELEEKGKGDSSLTVLSPKDINPDVVRGLQRNVAWARANNVRGVPFWIYRSRNGVKLAAGLVTDAIVDAATPLSDASAETGR